MIDDDLTRAHHRWREADDEGRDDDADAAFKAVYRRAVQPLRPVSAAFTVRTMEAVAAAAARDARRARRVRATLVPAGIAALTAGAYFYTGVIVSLISGAVVYLLQLTISAAVGIVTWLQAGADVWSVASSLARAASAFVADPAITATILIVQAIAIIALLALQRLLGSDGESYR